jgi:hypothetical protein
MMDTHNASTRVDASIGHSPALTALLDDIEMEVMRELLAASPAELVKHHNLKLFESDDGVGALMYFNRWMRLGIDRPATPEAINKAVEWLTVNCGTDWSIDLSPLAVPQQIPEWLARAGAKASSARIAILWRDAAPAVETIRSKYEVREVTPADQVDFGEIHRSAGSGWQHLGAITRALVGRPRWRSYVVFDGSEPVACSAMFIDRMVAWRGIAATVPAYRGRGAHTALVSRMTRDALRSNVQIFMAETVRDEPDAPAQSEGNLYRAGFRLSHLRVQYVPA